MIDCLKGKSLPSVFQVNPKIMAHFENLIAKHLLDENDVLMIVDFCDEADLGIGKIDDSIIDSEMAERRDFHFYFNFLQTLFISNNGQLWLVKKLQMIFSAYMKTIDSICEQQENTEEEKHFLFAEQIPAYGFLFRILWRHITE
jgi:hypothetical protein